eukprot:1080898-Prymnesium_polylepis.1
MDQARARLRRPPARPARPAAFACTLAPLIRRARRPSTKPTGTTATAALARAQQSFNLWYAAFSAVAAEVRGGDAMGEP